MAMYYFDNKIVSRGNGQSSIAKAAYNSATKIQDFKNQTENDYTKKQCDYSNIILPENAPDEYSDREYLWNKVEQTEKRKDSQLAREFIIALPTELNRENKINLACEFAESLADEGMIVDINIHHLDEKNPHSHLLCTLRGLDQNGEFEPKRIGNKKIRDWDSREKNFEWRQRWADIQNKYLEMNGFKERVSANSYKDQNIDLKPTKKEGWKSRKFEDETGIQSNISKYNDYIRTQNNKKINNKFISVADKISTKENVLPYLNKEKTIELKQLAKALKLYVSPINLFKETQKISDLKNKCLLLDPEKRNIKLDNLNTRQEKINRLNEIFEDRSIQFFKNNYPNEVNNFSKDEKIYITDYILNNQSDFPNSKDLNIIVDEKRYLESQLSLNIILGKKDISLNSIKEEDQFFSKKLIDLAKKNSLDMNDIINNNYSNLEDKPKIDYYMNKIYDLKKAKDIINDYYDIQTKDLFKLEDEYKAFISISTPEQKEELINLKAFYGKNQTIKMISNNEFIPRFTNEERSEITHTIALIKEKELKDNPTQFDLYFIQDKKEKLLNSFNINFESSNDLKYLYHECEYSNDKEGIKNLTHFDKIENETFRENNKNKILLPLSVQQFSRLINSFGELFKERMPKYMNNSKNKLKETDTMSEKEKKRNQRNRNKGISL